MFKIVKINVFKIIKINVPQMGGKKVIKKKYWHKPPEGKNICLSEECMLPMAPIRQSMNRMMTHQTTSVLIFFSSLERL